MKLEEVPVIGPKVTMADDVDAPYWDGLDEGVLRLPHCPQCDNWIWAPRSICPTCLRPDPEWLDVEPVGTVYSWIRTHHPFGAEFAEHLPYLTVLVELPQAGSRRLMGILLGDQDVDPVIGQTVRGVIQPGSELTDGAAVLRWERVDD